MSRVYGIILAGGQGARLGGVRKSELRIGGVRLIDGIIAKLAPFTGSLLIAAGPEESRPYPGTRIIEDEGNGPLGGISSVARALAGEVGKDDVFLTVAVDTPFLPGDFAPVLIEAARNSRAAYAAWGDNFYPTNAAMKAELLIHGLEFISVHHGPRGLLEKINARRIDWADRSSFDPFSSVNTVSELLSHQRRAIARMEK